MSSEGFHITDADDQAILTTALTNWKTAAENPEAHGLNFERFLLVA
jgi:hypothetical protein